MAKPTTRAAEPAPSDPGARPHRHRRRDGGRAFMPDLAPGYAQAPDSLAENLAEAFLESATSGEERGEVLLNEFVPEDIGGPFLEEQAPEDDGTETRPAQRLPRPRST